MSKEFGKIMGVFLICVTGAYAASDDAFETESLLGDHSILSESSLSVENLSPPEADPKAVKIWGHRDPYWKEEDSNVADYDVYKSRNKKSLGAEGEKHKKKQKKAVKPMTAPDIGKQGIPEEKSLQRNEASKKKMQYVLLEEEEE